MRVSKPPEERKLEIMDTAMRLFAEKGYEATTMTDIAREMNVVSGLCYRYFKSKEALYQEALQIYASDCSASMIRVMDGEYNSLEECMQKVVEVFQGQDGTERYHGFFHGQGNQFFHAQLASVMLALMQPHCAALLKQFKEKGFIQIDDCEAMATFITYGLQPILDDESKTSKEKMDCACNLLERIL